MTLVCGSWLSLGSSINGKGFWLYLLLLHAYYLSYTDAVKDYTKLNHLRDSRILIAPWMLPLRFYHSAFLKHCSHIQLSLMGMVVVWWWLKLCKKVFWFWLWYSATLKAIPPISLLPLLVCWQPFFQGKSVIVYQIWNMRKEKNSISWMYLNSIRPTRVPLPAASSLPSMITVWNVLRVA